MSTKKPSTAKKAPATKKAAAKKTSAAKKAAPATPKASSEMSSAENTTAPKSIEESAVTPPAKANAVSPAVKEAKSPVVKGESAPVIKEHNAPVVRESIAPVVKEETKAPMLKEKAASPAIKEKSEVMLQENMNNTAKTSDASSTTPKAAANPLIKHNVFQSLGSNPYMPHVATVKEVINETSNIMTFRVVIDDEEAMKNFTFLAGQVGQLSLFGAGEATFVINSPPSNKEYLQFSVMRTGEVTNALHRLSPGDKIGVRGPLGNYFPRQEWQGKDIFFVGGGIGMAPIRTILLDVLEHKDEYGKISLLYGARTPKDMAFSYEVEAWQNNPDLDCHLTIDSPCEGWECLVGLIPDILTRLAPDPQKTIVVLCGPPIMIKFTIEALEKMNFPDENIITTLEKRMKCGIGICGRCNLGSEYVCVSGPVYSWAQLKKLPPEL